MGSNGECADFSVQSGNDASPDFINCLCSVFPRRMHGFLARSWSIHPCRMVAISVKDRNVRTRITLHSILLTKSRIINDEYCDSVCVDGRSPDSGHGNSEWDADCSSHTIIQLSIVSKQNIGWILSGGSNSFSTMRRKNTV